MTLTRFLESYEGFNKHFESKGQWDAQYDHFKDALRAFWRSQGKVISW